jgi:hypothetical protein
MKHSLFTVVIMLFFLPALSAGQSSDSIRITGFNVYYANSASGYGKSLNLNISIEKDRRHLETGIIMQQESARISGGEILYRHYFSSLYRDQDSGIKSYRNFRFFFQYNLIFRYSNIPDIVNITQATMHESVNTGSRVATYEHYAGMGTQIRVLDNLFLNAGLGYGAILGSIAGKYLDQQHYNMGGRKTDYGPVIRFGLSCLLRR